MSLTLSAVDLARYEEASRVMLSPLAVRSVEEWRREVNRAVGRLFRSDTVVSMLPQGGRLFLSDERPDFAAAVESFTKAYTSEGIFLTDAVVDLWNRLRRQSRQDVFSWAMNEEMIGRVGYRMRDSEIVSEVLGAHHLQDFIGFYAASPQGEAMLWLLSEHRDGMRFGEAGIPLLRILLPSFKAGVEALMRFDAQRQALDFSSEASVVFGVDRRELHRNAALDRLLDADPERERVQVEIKHMAYVLHPLVFAGAGGAGAAAFTPAVRVVETRRGRYELRGTFLPPGSFGPDASLMLFVSRQSGPQLPEPAVLRERYGLTGREAEVALLLAEGLSNDEIAERLCLSPHTARRHTANIFEKLEVNSRKGLALKFLKA